MKNLLSKTRFYIFSIIYMFWSVVYLAIYKITKISRKTDWFCNYMTFRTYGIKINTIGKTYSDVNMYIINHQTFFDVAAMETVSRKRHLIWLAKKELTKNYVVRNILKAHEAIIVDREDSNQLISIVKHIKKNVITDPTKVFSIFPEGTRNRDVNHLGKFKSGAEVIANMLKLKVQPVVISRMKDTIDIDKKDVNKKHPITISYLEPFIADKKDENWLNDVRDKMEDEYQRLNNN